MNTIIQLATNSALLSLLAGFILGVYNLIQVPRILSLFLGLYLVFAIGLKGGMCLGVGNSCAPALIGLAFIGLLLGFIQPFFNYFILKKITNLDFQTSVVVAAQYGSISIVTFLAALTFLNQNNIFYNTFLIAIAALMEVPALISGLILLKKDTTDGGSFLHSLSSILYKIITSKKISFIFIGFFVGFLFRYHQDTIIPKVILKPFKLMLILFMIDMGIKIAAQRAYISQFTWHLIAFGTAMPIASGTIAIIICKLLGISVGSSLLFAVLIGSASYIAVPAVMSTQAPKAKEVIYMPLSLAVTLPFNIAIGIPYFYFIAQYLN